MHEFSAKCAEVLFPSGASEKLKDRSQATSLSGGLPLRFRDSRSFLMTVYLWLVYKEDYLKITTLLQFVLSCDRDKQTPFQLDFTFSGLVHLI